MIVIYACFYQKIKSHIYSNFGSDIFDLFSKHNPWFSFLPTLFMRDKINHKKMKQTWPCIKVNKNGSFSAKGLLKNPVFKCGYNAR